MEKEEEKFKEIDKQEIELNAINQSEGLKKIPTKSRIHRDSKKEIPQQPSMVFNEKTTKYFKDLVNFHKAKKRKVFFEKKVKTLLVVIYYLFSSLANIISVFVFIVDSQIPDTNVTAGEVLKTIDFSFSLFFSIEFVISFITAENKLTFFLKYEPYLDMATIIPSYITFFVKQDTQVNLSFLRILRVLRVLRVLRLLKFVRMLKSDDEKELDSHSSSGFKINKVKKQIISFIVSLVSTIFVSAGVVTFLNRLMPNSFNISNLTFIDAVYFIIVTSSTLGYGDIVPTQTLSRMLVIFLLIFLIYFFSEQVAQIVSLLRMTDTSEVNFTCENHNIIIGDFSLDALKSFLDEFYDVDNINSKIKTKPESIIILDEKNSKIKEDLPLEPYEGRVKFLSTKTYSIEAFMKSNFEEADTIISLNQNYKSNPWISDKINDFTLKNIKDFNQSNSENLTKKKLYLQSLILKENLDSKRLAPFLNIQILKLKSCLFAKSIYCKGYITFITNLFNSTEAKLKIKNPMLKKYLKGMKNSLVAVPLPKEFDGIDFRKLSREIYFKSVKKAPGHVKHEQMDPNNAMPSTHRVLQTYSGIAVTQSKEDEKKFIDQNQKNQSDFSDLNGILMIGILKEKMGEEERKKIENEDELYLKEIVGNNIDKIMFNPKEKKDNVEEDYKINYKVDKGIFLTVESKEFVMEFLKTVDLDATLSESSKKLEIINTNQVNSNNNQSTNSGGNKMAKHLRNHFKNNYKKNMNYITKQHSKLKFLDPSSRFIEADMFSSSISNQITIFGFHSYIEEIITKIRSQNLSNPIMVVSEVYDEEIKQKLLKKFSNMNLVLGDFLDLKTLENIHTENSSFIIILSTKNFNTINEDSNAVLAARIIEQYFKIPYVVEVFDNVNCRFLGSLPFLNDNLADEVTEYIYPNYMQGKIFFTSFLDRLLPRSFTSFQEILCLQSLIENDFSKEESILEEEDAQDDIEIKLYSKSDYSIFSIPVPEYLEGKTYFNLFEDLTSLKDMYIPLGIYAAPVSKESLDNNLESQKNKEKCESCNNCEKCKSNENLCKKCKYCLECNNYQDLDNNFLLNKYLNIINNEIKNNVLEYLYIEKINTPIFFTNPPNSMLLNSNMEVLVLGKFDKMIESDLALNNMKSSDNKRLSKLEKISEEIVSFSKKKEIVKKFEKYLQKRISQIELQNFD